MTMHLAAAPKPTIIDWNDQQYRILLAADASEGRLGAFESIVPPNGGPPRHYHQNEDEFFYVLEGETVFWLEGATMTKKAGEAMLIPRGKEHTFTAVGSTRARLVATVTPGGFEGFFAKVSARGLRIPEDLSEVAKLSAEYGMIVTGPPLHLASPET